MKISTPYLLTTKIPEFSGPSRSRGVHVSECYSRIAQRHEQFVGSGSKIDVGLAEIGHSWEDAFIRRLKDHSVPERFIQIGELEIDGLFGTPDLIDTNPYSDRDIIDWMLAKDIYDIPGERVIWDAKFTKVTSRGKEDGNETHFWKYWCQLKCYCYMMDLSVGVSSVLFVNANYKYQRPYDYWVFIRKFTEWELIENWDMIRKEAGMMENDARLLGFCSVADMGSESWILTTPDVVFRDQSKSDRKTFEKLAQKLRRERDA